MPPYVPSDGTLVVDEELVCVVKDLIQGIEFDVSRRKTLQRCSKNGPAFVIFDGVRIGAQFVPLSRVRVLCKVLESLEEKK